MAGIPNTVRRAGTYHFRRLIPLALRQAFRRTELTVSLRTTNPAEAGNRARHAYLASEELFAKVRLFPMLSDADLARLVQDFYTTVLDRENQLRLLGRLRIDDPQRLARADHWKDVSERTRGDLATSNFMSADLVAASAIKKHGLTGTLKDHEVAQIQQAMLRGGIDLADALRARYEGDFTYRPKDPLLTMALERHPSMTTPEAPAVEVSGNSAARSTKGATGPDRPTASPKGSQELFTTVADTFRQTQLRRKVWENQTALQARKTYALFAEIAGNRPLGEYDRGDAVFFKNLLQDLPADYGKAAKFRNMATAEIAASTKDQDVARLSPRTVQRHLAALSTLWESMIEAGQIGTNIFAGFKFAATKKAKEQREMWPEDKLNALFATPVWAGCQSAERRNKPGKLVIKDEKFWLPLIAVFSGMRQEEICQLRTSDIRQESGIWVFDVNSESDRKVKTGESIRLVPVHSTLIKAGFLVYVEAQRAAKQDLVFSQLTRGGADQRLGHNFSKWFTRYRREVGLYRPDMNFHSFRHSATTFMQWSDILEQVIDKVTGHVRQGETARYTKNFRIEQLRDAIEGIRPKIDLSHLINNAGSEAAPSRRGRVGRR